MDFFARQDKARRNTQWLVVYFLLGVAVTVAAVYFLCFLIFKWELIPAMLQNPEKEISLWDLKLFLWSAGGTLAVVALGSCYKSVQLGGGGGNVATLLGGRLLDRNATDDPDEQRLLNVVEEMAIASGTPVPEVYILDHEQGINAFAAGKSTSDAAIGVTRGTVQLLSRDELQGVIAHEFSHILNGDMRLNLRLMGILFGLLCLTIIGRILLYTAGTRHHSMRFAQRGKGGNPLPLLGLGLILIGFIGVFFGKLIKSAISRQREYLADAAAVQFTRNPAGISGALKKIGGLVFGSRIRAASAEEASHMFFGNGLARNWTKLLSTHPPLAERIKAIDPQFDGRFPQVEAKAAEPPPIPSKPAQGRGTEGQGEHPPELAALLGIAAASSGQTGSRRTASRQTVDPESVLSNVGTPTRVHLDYASELIERLPPQIRQASHEPFGAAALVYGLLLSPDSSAREQQLKILESKAEPAIYREMQRLLAGFGKLDPAAKLPVVDLALPALKKLAPSQFERFRSNVQVIIESDRQIDLFEYTLQKILFRHLTPHFRKVKTPIIQYYVLRALQSECSVLISGLAHVGHSEPAQVESAFRHGTRRLQEEGQGIRLLPADQCNLSQIDRALDRLAEAAPPLKRKLMNAVAHTVAADQVIKPKEAELLRAIADALGCPLPPFVESV